MLVNQFLSLLVFLVVHQLLDLVVVIVGLGIIVVVGTAGPEGRLVKRNTLILSPSENISAHIAVTDEQAVKPDISGGLVVPENHLPARFGGGFRAGNQRGYSHTQ